MLNYAPGQRMPVSKDTLVFLQNPVVSKWANTLQNERGRLSYAYHLKRFLAGIKKTPSEFLADIEKTPKQMSIDTKAFLTSVKSKGTARIMMNSVKSFVRFYETDLPLNGLKIRAPRTQKKPYLSWPNAERIIGAAKEPYRSAYRFLLWAGLGLDEFAEIQNSSTIQTDIEKQRTNEQPYIRIDLRPRKSNTDTYYALVPKLHVPKFPMLTLRYESKEKRSRGGKFIGNLAMETNWTRACKRVGLYQHGMGPHTLRSAFSSQCGKLGIKPEVAEFQMGHGPADQLGYRRELEDEEYVAHELEKLWKSAVPITTADLEQQNQEIARLKEELTTAKQIAAATTEASLKQQAEMWAVIKALKDEQQTRRSASSS
jgi:hypothetical protein